MPADVTPYWEPWLGLPHEIGADPRDGKAACCLVIAQIVLTNANYSFPPLSKLLRLVKDQDWIGLQQTFYDCCNPVKTAEVHAISLIRNKNRGLGLATVVAPNTLITIHHHKGVITLPVDRLHFLRFYKVKE